MKTLYFDCGMGAAGDMLSASVLELTENADAVVEVLNNAGIPHVRFLREPSVKCGITGTHLTVTVHDEEEDEHLHEHTHEHHHHHHSGIDEIAHIVSHLQVNDNVKKNILSVYDLIAQAESHVHGVPVTDIHFHEVGTLDAVADITAFCVLMDILGYPRIVTSPIHVGSGTVRCAHGILPVPAPATAYLLQGIPVYSGNITSELCTPTGAALLKHFSAEFGRMPVMTVEKIGYGMGKKDFPQANCVRAMLGSTGDLSDTVTKLECNLDDMTPEAIGFAMDILLAKGALDVWTSPIGMKKCRPGTLLSVLCRNEDKEAIIKLLFLHTTTIGIRESEHSRYTLSRSLRTISTPYGDVHIKCSEGYGVSREKPEYDDLAKIAARNGIPLSEISKNLK